MRIAHDRTVRGRRLAREEANSASGGEGNFVIATECRLSPDSGPSRGDPCRPAIRPSTTYAAAICYVRFTSIPAGRNAQTPAIRRWLGEGVRSTDSVEEPLQPNEGKERGDDDQYWAR